MDMQNVEAVELTTDLVSGVDEIAKLINETPRKTHYMLSKNLVPGAFRRGSRWFALKSEVHAGLRRLARGEAA
jgi:hypothetical protein